jgi:hypothetical protein
MNTELIVSVAAARGRGGPAHAAVPSSGAGCKEPAFDALEKAGWLLRVWSGASHRARSARPPKRGISPLMRNVERATHILEQAGSTEVHVIGSIF